MMVLSRKSSLIRLLCANYSFWLPAHLDDTIGAKGCAIHTVLARLKNGWSEFRDLSPFLIRRCAYVEEIVYYILLV